jgi:MFS family permease
MGRIIGWALALGIIGLAVGYLLFGRIGGEYVAIDTLLRSPENVFAQIGRKITGLSEARQNILISGGAGAVIGAVFGAIRR